MFSFGMVAGFVAEVVAFALVCAVLWPIQLGGESLGAWVLALGILAFVLRVGIVPFTALFAALRNPRPPAEMRVGIAGGLWMVTRETLAMGIAVFFLIPFAQRLVALRRGSVVRSTQPPVLFIHGFNANAGIWAPMLHYLEGRGLTNLFTLNLHPRFGDIDDFAQQVAARVNRIRSTTRATRLILVGHSMGGLVARAYVEQCGGDEFVSKVITIGTPHHGTLMAQTLPGGCTRQMRPHSEWLDELNREENLPASVPYVSIYSPQDNIIVPYTSSELGQARNIPVAGRGHFELAFAEHVGNLVYHEITNT